MNCGTCKRWNQKLIRQMGLNHYDFGDYPDPFTNRDEYGTCLTVRNTFPRPGDREMPPPGQELAYAMDGESYEADLITHRTFGCVQYEQGPNDETDIVQK